jgi:phosphoglycolate phosphatase
MSRTGIEVAVFDLDGTLIDTMGDIAASVNEALAQAGLPARGVGEIKPLVGWGLRNLIASLLPGLEAADPGRIDALAESTVAAYAQNPVSRTEAYQGIPDALRGLRERGIKTAVLSNKSDELVGRILGMVFPEHEFDAARGLRPGFKPKPDPAQCLEMLSSLGTGPGRSVFIGDSAVDIRTARAAGMRAIACLWGFRPEAELEEAGPDSIARRPRDILGLVDALGRL